jgi:PAS domain-containing protein
VESSDSLRRFSTEWDSLPIVGDMIRYVAHREFTQSRPIAKRITQRLIAKQTDEEFDKQLKSQISTAQDKFESRLLGPLQSLQLSPLVMDMQSTNDRLIARYRLADDSHLSSYTPRPLAPGDSQLSLQIHQSIFNNLADRAIDSDRDWTIQQLSDSLADILQQPRPELPSDTPHDVTLRFASPNPISIEFEDGKMWLTLRIASLEQPGRMHLKNFVIRSSYVTTIDGLQAELLRDGVISIDGHRLGARDRVPLRAIFTKVFSARTSVPMVAQSLLEDPRAQGLVVSQFEMRDGWLAIAISDRSAISR